MQFNPVWFRAGTYVSPLQIPAFQDVGTLTVSGESICYTGKKGSLSIPFSTIKRVVFGRLGNDWLNTWVSIEHGGHMTLFKDGGFLGWAGDLGGNRRIYDEIARAAAQASVSIEIRRANHISREGYAWLFLNLILWAITFVGGIWGIWWGLSGLLNR